MPIIFVDLLFSVFFGSVLSNEKRFLHQQKLISWLQCYDGAQHSNKRGPWDHKSSLDLYNVHGLWSLNLVS